MTFTLCHYTAFNAYQEYYINSYRTTSHLHINFIEMNVSHMIWYTTKCDFKRYRFPFSMHLLEWSSSNLSKPIWNNEWWVISAVQSWLILNLHPQQYDNNPFQQNCYVHCYNNNLFLSKFCNKNLIAITKQLERNTWTVTLCPIRRTIWLWNPTKNNTLV